jgi:YidC/Oxa1 family membrane protein insertase
MAWGVDDLEAVRAESDGLTILQTMIFRWTLNDEKMLAEMEANKKKKAGKPKSGFMERLEKMQREQQRLAREQAKAANKRR